MSSKPGLTAWERWELASFDTPDETAATRPAAQPANEAAPAVPQRLTFSEEELAALKEAAYQEAFAAGRAAGHAEGYAAGEQEGEAAGRARTEALGKEEAARLAELISRLEKEIGQIEVHVADDLLALALELARKVIAHTVVAKPELIVEVIHGALAQLPVQHAAIHLHPEDASLARLYAGDALTHAGHRIHENAKLSRGDVVIDVGGSHLDATLATRWRRVLDSLGQQSPWLIDEEPAVVTAPPAAAPITPAAADEEK